MGTLLASTLIARANEIAQDVDQVTWTPAQGLSWLNDAQLAICNLRPDASVSRGTVKLSPGVTQTIEGRRLMAVHWNMGSDGSTRGRAIRLIERGVMDDSYPDWPAETADPTVLEYMYDTRNPQQFDVYPPVPDTPDVWIEASQATNPDEIADASDPITLDDVYAPALVSWMAYRYFSRDSEETPNWARAAGFYRDVFNLLDVKLRFDLMVNPKLRNHLEKGRG